MRACLSQKILPLILCFVAGVALSAAGGLTRSSEAESRKRAAADGAAASRTWLVVRSRPELKPSETLSANDRPHFVHLRAKFGADGMVSEITPTASTLSDASVAAAIGAARRIKFTPATEDGIPLDVLAEVRYDLGAMFAMGVDGKGRRFCVSNVLPATPSVSIVSVPGATEREGWRVVYE